MHDDHKRLTHDEIRRRIRDGIKAKTSTTGIRIGHHDFP